MQRKEIVACSWRFMVHCAEAIPTKRGGRATASWWTAAIPGPSDGLSMPHRFYTILLVNSERDDAQVVDRTFGADGGDGGARFVAATPEEARRFLAEREFDLIVVGLGRDAEAGLGAIGALSRDAPGKPLIALLKHWDEDLAINALRGGAQDCLIKSELSKSRLGRAARYAIERHRLRVDEDRRRGQREQTRELAELGFLANPPPLAISARSLGMLPIAERAQGDFLRLMGAYKALIDRAVDGRDPERGFLAEGLTRIAAELGGLGAGPRDVIDLHKAAIAGNIGAASVAQARACIEEGRLVLLQLMGYLVSFYRALSWGEQPRLRPRADFTNDPSAGAETTGRDWHE